MFNCKYKRIISFLLTISIVVTFFVSFSTVSYAWTTDEETGNRKPTDWDELVQVITTCLFYDASQIKAILGDGSFYTYLKNQEAWNEYWNDDNLKYVEQTDTDGKVREKIVVSSKLIDWLCKEIDAYYISVNKENISDYYDQTKGYYDYGSTNDVSYDLLYGSVEYGKVGVRMTQHFGTGKTLAYKYPIYGLLSENKVSTGITYYMADLYFYNPLLVDKTVAYKVRSGIEINVQAVKDGLVLAGKGNSYDNQAGLLSIYGGYGVNSTLGSLYILEDGSLGGYGGYKGDTGSSVAFYNLPSITLSDPADVALIPGHSFSTWQYTNLQLRTKIPFFDSYEKLEQAAKTGDLTGAVNFSKLSAFAGGYSGDDVTLDADTLEAIEKILDSNLDIQDKIDQIGDIIGVIGGIVSDNTEELKKMNALLEQIKAILENNVVGIQDKIDAVGKLIADALSGTTGEMQEMNALLEELNAVLENRLLGLRDKLDELGKKVDAALSDSTAEIKKSNSFLEKIKAVLEDILGTLKSIRRWTVVDTVIDGADFVESLISDTAGLVKDFIKVPLDTFKGIMASVESLGDALRVKFPFCIPWDVAFLLGLFRATPMVPHYEIPIKYGSEGSIVHIDEVMVIDFQQFGIVSRICRTFLTVIFCKGLLDLTMKIVNMKEQEYNNS